MFPRNKKTQVVDNTVDLGLSTEETKVIPAVTITQIVGDSTWASITAGQLDEVESLIDNATEDDLRIVLGKFIPIIRQLKLDNEWYKQSTK